MGFNNAMAIASLTQAGANFAGSMGEAGALRSQGAYQQQQMDFNAKLAEFQAKDATDRGNTAANQRGLQTRQLIGKQRAAAAAQGISVDSGSALDLQADSASLGELDKAQIKTNAWMEAWGLKTQADQYRFQGQMAKAGAEASANSTLLTGGLRALGDLTKAGSYAYEGYKDRTGGKK